MVSLIHLTSDNHDDSHLCNSAAGPVDDYHLVMTHFVNISMPALHSLTVSSSGLSGAMKFRHLKNIDTLPQCIWGSFGINKEQIKVFKELKEHFWRKGVLYQTIKTKERLCHSCPCSISSTLSLG